MKANLELLQEAEGNLEWFQENFERIQEQFEKQIIAVKDKRVIASARNIEELLKIPEEKEIDQSEVLIENIPAKNEIVIF